MVEVDEDKVVYELTFDLPDAGLSLPDAGLALPDMDVHSPIGDDHDNMVDIPEPPPKEDTQASQCYPMQTKRSVLRHQHYNTYSHRTTFLQLGMARAHRSVLGASLLLRMSKEEQMLAMTSSNLLDNMINDVIHKVDPEMMMKSEDKIKVWGYLMMRYNLKPSLRKFGNRGATSVVKELTQLHVINTWMAMDPTKLSREEQM